MACGCGSEAVSELPPAAGPPARPVSVDAPGGPAVAVLAGRTRVLELRAPRTRKLLARAPAGVGPTHVAAVADRLYVTDTRGGALLVFTTRPKLALVRRVFLPGGPAGIRVDAARHRLWVTLTARREVVELAATGRPHPLLRLPTGDGSAAP